MGKIITQKDFWVCSEGNMPSQLQGSRDSTAKREDGELYITVEDKACVSWVDFSCKHYWKLAALAALVAVVVGVIVIGTGGTALILVGAIAGAAYGSVKAIAGSMLCGHKLADKRKWNMSKNDMKIQGINVITSDCKMFCTVGGVITYAPHIKSWGQAIALGAANTIGDILTATFKGACIGAMFAGVGAILEGGLAAVAEMGVVQALKGVGTNVVRNYASTWGVNVLRTEGGKLALSWMGKKALFGLSLRSLMGIQGAAQQYGTTGELGWDTLKAAGGGIVGMERGTAEAAQNLVTFDEEGNYKGTIWDVGAIALWGVGGGKFKEVEAKPNENTKSTEPKNEETKSEETKGEEKENVEAKEVKQEEVKTEEKEFEAWEDPNYKAPAKLSPEGKAILDQMVEDAEGMTNRERPGAAGILEKGNERIANYSQKGFKPGEIPPDLHPLVKEWLTDIAPENIKGRNNHGKCAEPTNISEWLYKAEEVQGMEKGSMSIEKARTELEGVKSEAVEIKPKNKDTHGKHKDACDSCNPLLDYFGIEEIGHNH